MKKAAYLLLLFFFCGAAYADDDGEREHHKKEHGHSAASVTNPTYEEVCGSCHFAYQPWLLPSASWKKILAGAEDHYGNAIQMDGGQEKEVAGFLLANAADKSSNKRSKKILKSLDGQVPLRITDVPYIAKKHHDLSRAILARPSIAGLQNCSACHRTAPQGVYDDDNVIVPP
ncbi:MAG: cytochrome C [Thermodesulfobacteriota bacterium]